MLQLIDILDSIFTERYMGNSKNSNYLIKTSLTTQSSITKLINKKLLLVRENNIYDNIMQILSKQLKKKNIEYKMAS